MSHDEDVKDHENFYAEDRIKLNSIKKTEFVPVKPCSFVDDDPWYIQVYYAIYRWVVHDLQYYHRDIQYGVRNLWRWLPFIWRDRNWDHGYLGEMLLKKLKYMKPEIHIHVIAGPHHDALDRCIVLLEELIKLDGCDCHRLGADCDIDVAKGCWDRQVLMRKEFGELYAAFNPMWWD